jgi:hypothetical protein
MWLAFPAPAPAQAPAPAGTVAASFTITPDAPLTAADVTFTSTSTFTGAQNSIVSESWDLDNDGVFGDQTGSTAVRQFAAAGAYPVTLRVTDAGGRTSDATQVVTIGDRPPTAAFSFAPLAPVAGQPVTFTSQSTDPEGPIAETWDLDGDGTFADAAGPVATASFAAGPHVVTLRVVDADGVDSVTAVEVDVAAPVGRPIVPAAVGGTRGGVLTPFPIVRLVGEASGTGTVLKLMTITAPQTATAIVRCRGGGCPFTRRSQRLTEAKRGSGPAGTRTLRILTFAGQSLSPGAKIQVFVTDPLQMGKYTRFTMRRSRAPQRVDHCTAVGRTIVTNCPPGAKR